MVALIQTRTASAQRPESAILFRKLSPQRGPHLLKPPWSYFRARYYDPATAEFTSPDPLEYVDGMSLYRGYFVPKDIDLSGFKVKKLVGGSVPKNGCKIAVRCGRVFYGLGTHCGLMVDMGNGIVWGVDGSPGPVNTLNWESDPQDWGDTFDYKTFPDDVCVCLMEHTTDWNDQKISRDPLGPNSNWTLKCMLKSCGLKINWGTYPTPRGYDFNQYRCLEWHTVDYGTIDGSNVKCKECKNWEECPPVSKMPSPRRPQKVIVK